MAVFFVRFKVLNPRNQKPYFGNFELPYENVADALHALERHTHIVATRYYAVHKPEDPSTLLVKKVEERTLTIEDIGLLSLSRYKFEFDLGKSAA
ncbi:hypothetical protein EVC30_122 [Rhizobium phage RHph_Y1_11]|nr:hypothetical protein EVC30_122 [Rhizobium phage RHph_Y1_11]